MNFSSKFWFLVLISVSSWFVSGAAEESLRFRHPSGQYELSFRSNRTAKEIRFTLRRFVPKTSLNDAISNQWFSIMLNTRKLTMRGSDFMAIVFRTGTNSSDIQCDVSDRWTKESGYPALDEAFGGKQDLVDISSGIEYEDGSQLVTLVCAFTRPWKTPDCSRQPATDLEITDQFLQLGWAFGSIGNDGTWLKHVKTVGGVSVNLVSASLQSGSSLSRPYLLIWLHGGGMIIAWFLLMVPATLLARYYKRFIPVWFKIHYRIHCFALFTTLLAFWAIWAHSEYELEFNSIHTVLGFVLVLAAVFGQSLLGYLSNKLWFPGKPPHWYPDKMHWWLGRGILVAGMINCFLGIDKYAEYVPPTIWSPKKLTASWWFISLVLVTLVIWIAFCEFVIGQQHEHLFMDHDNANEERDDAASSNEQLISRPSDADVALNTQETTSTSVEKFWQRLNKYHVYFIGFYLVSCVFVIALTGILYPAA